MEDYLARLERLTSLFERGALSKDEFEQEKARLRWGPPPERERATEDQRRKWLLLSAIGLAAAMGLALAYLTILDLPSENGEAGSYVTNSTKLSAGPGSLNSIIAFSDTVACEPSASFADLLDEIANSVTAENQASDGTVRIADVAAALTPEHASINRGGVEATLSRLTLREEWHGLDLVEIRTTRWSDGLAEGFQLKFAEPASQAGSVLRQVGFKLPKLGALEKRAENYMHFESAGGGSVLTCIRPSTKVAKGEEVPE